MPIVVIGLTHHTSSVDVREKFAFADAAIPTALQTLKERGVVDEAVIVSTCNRVELYAATSQAADRALSEIRQFLIEHHAYEGNLNGEMFALAEPRSVEHLFKVACGLDSMVLGETEILGQLKKAYDLALQNKHTGGRLNKAFQNAFNVAKKIRTETNIQRGSVSVGSVAVELAEKIFNNLNERNVMVIGAGDTSEKTAKSLLSRGAKSIIVANRSFDKAEALAAELGGRAVNFDTWLNEFEHVDIVISSTSAPHYVLDRAKLAPLMKLRKNRPMLLIDIAVPRDIDPEVNLLNQVYLYNIDDLQEMANDYMQQRREEIAKCEAIIQDRARTLLDGLRRAMTSEPTAPDGCPVAAQI
ncbi:MAG TPA: glutamyl-tRNA reductase [Verrucomicrobiae bacterium]|nr:glutamyl-tRNA reductase [Verrucomicrobiae bacterium]